MMVDVNAICQICRYACFFIDAINFLLLAYDKSAVTQMFVWAALK
jgi:hypothetical protein